MISTHFNNPTLSTFSFVFGKTCTYVFKDKKCLTACPCANQKDQMEKGANDIIDDMKYRAKVSGKVISMITTINKAGLTGF